jgi:hypothetical protein
MNFPVCSETFKKQPSEVSSRVCFFFAPKLMKNHFFAYEVPSTFNFLIPVIRQEKEAKQGGWASPSAMFMQPAKEIAAQKQSLS